MQSTDEALGAHCRNVAASFPPPTSAQLDRLAGLLKPTKAGDRK